MVGWRCGCRGLGAAGLGRGCLTWAIDNNLTTKVSASDAVFVAASKGLVAGSVNTRLALALGATWPTGGAVGGPGARVFRLG